MGISMDELRLTSPAECNKLRLQAIAPLHEELAVIRVEAFGIGQASPCVTDRIPGWEPKGRYVECVELAQHQAEVFHGWSG